MMVMAGEGVNGTLRKAHDADRKIAALRLARTCYDHLGRRPRPALAGLGWLRRERNSRALSVTPDGARALRKAFGVRIPA